MIYELVFCLILISAAQSCEIKNADNDNFDMTKYTGFWYSRYHRPKSYTDKYECFIDSYTAHSKKSADLVTSVFVKEDNERKNYTADVTVSKNVLHLKYNPDSPWSGDYYVLATDEVNFTIVAACAAAGGSEPFMYVAFRNTKPCGKAVAAADHALKKFNLSLKDFVNDCTW
ncbi:crustacyanin-A2 subunit-like [Periplaneta americana]|uniref:crustacyanin-A2 subunit-like n=1 Tax=Periplaneta americana TaxID=6978 RepID=UPI0037E8A757